MTIEDDEILIKNLKAELTLAQQSLKRTLDLFVQHGNRELPFGAVNDKLKRVLAKNALAAVDAIVENETKLTDAIENAGKPDNVRKSPNG